MKGQLVKYDDASWHSGGDFPAVSPDEFGGTHIGLYLRFCFTKGWAGELHTDDEPEAVAAVVNGDMPGTDFLFRYCDGKFTDEDLNDHGNAVTSKYYGANGHYLGDYAACFGDQMYVAAESAHDFALFTEMVEERVQSGDLST